MACGAIFLPTRNLGAAEDAKCYVGFHFPDPGLELTPFEHGGATLVLEDSEVSLLAPLGSVRWLIAVADLAAPKAGRACRRPWASLESDGQDRGYRRQARLPTVALRDTDRITGQLGEDSVGKVS